MSKKRLGGHDVDVGKGQGDGMPDVDDPTITMRPDGFYWRALDGKQEFGPFESLELTRLDRAASEDDSLEPGETLQEAESEIGIAEWIDPETGEPAYGLSPPHLEEE